MDLLSLIMEIRYRQRTLLVFDDKRQKIFKLITGKDPQNSPSDVIQGAEYRDEPTRTRVLLEENRFAAAVEEDNIDEANKRLFEVIGNIYNEIDYQSNIINRIGVRTQWVSCWNESFASLLNRYKKVFYKPNSLLTKATDIAVHFTLIDESNKINFTTGPMKPQQGQTLLVFKNRNLPHDFIYTDVDYFCENVQTYDLEKIKQFITLSIKFGKDRASETVGLITDVK